MRFAAWMSAALAAFALAACGGSGGGSDSCTPGATAVMTITATGLSPPNVCVVPGGTVTFSNRTTVSQHLEFEDVSSCGTIPEIEPNSDRSAQFPNTFNCTFHDGTLTGTVAVTSGVVTGGGY